MSSYPQIVGTSFGQITVGEVTYSQDVYILVDGQVKRRDRGLARQSHGTSHKIGPVELEALCRGRPEVLFIGTGQSGLSELSPEGRQFLHQQGIEFQAMPTPQVIEAYNHSDRPKAALIHVTC